MTTPAEWYADVLDTPSDIRGHVEHFVKLVAELDATRVIELGVRSGNSTAAWLYALEGRGHLWSVDTAPVPLDVGAFDDWTFVLGDDIDPAVLAQLPEPVDLVFVDTSHEYEHTRAELDAYVPRVRPGGLVLLHDTELEWPELVEPTVPFPVKTAVSAYCHLHGLTWQNFEHSYGLAVIHV